MRFFSVLLLASGCGFFGGSSSGSGGGGAGAFPGPPSEAWSPSGAVDLYAVEPNIAACEPGEISQALRDAALSDFNQIRALHGLPLVTYDPEGEVRVQATALMICANVKLSHTPAQSEHCFTPEAASGASASNLLLNAGTHVGEPGLMRQHLMHWLIDRDVANLGHRRWLLDPFVKNVAFGLVVGEPIASSQFKPVLGAALQVIHPQTQPAVGMERAFVAYPFGDYPAELVDESWFFSFSVIANKGERKPNTNIGWDDVAVTITASTGTPLKISQLEASNEASITAGVPNVLKWKTSGVQKGVQYHVVVSPVRTGGADKTFEYDFRLL